MDQTFTLAMSTFEWQMLALEFVRVLWVMAFGACVGSLINVLAYRIPRGLNYVTPASRCPACDTKLTWRENVPVLGWLLLRGKCRFCRSPISAEYPIIEALVAVLWGAAYLACYGEPGALLGLDFRVLQPEWARGGFVETWPIFLVVIVLFSSLVAMTLVDAKTFTIPAVLTNVPTVVGFVVLPLFAVYVQMGRGKLTYAAPGWNWSIATPAAGDWMLVGAALGGGVGLLVSLLLLNRGIFKRSFLDYQQWEEQQVAAIKAKHAEEGKVVEGEEFEVAATDLWVAYPHARREMLREVLFVLPVLSFAAVGAALATRYCYGPFNPSIGQADALWPVPLWLMVLAGVVLGYLIGGGVVWAVRILGSVAFGKEAMGLGDVHMMAAVGACLGWIDPVLAFFGAAFLGVFWAILGRIFSGVFKKVMPFGPFLAAATVLVFFAKPLIEWGLTRMTHASPPVNLP